MTCPSLNNTSLPTALSEAEKDTWTKEKAARGINRGCLLKGAITSRTELSTGGTGSLGVKHCDKLAGEVRSNQAGRGVREEARYQGGRSGGIQMKRG